MRRVSDFARWMLVCLAVVLIGVVAGCPGTGNGGGGGNTNTNDNNTNDNNTNDNNVNDNNVNDNNTNDNNTNDNNTNDNNTNDNNTNDNNTNDNGNGLDGASLYADNCAGCHAADGSGNIGPDIRGESAAELSEGLELAIHGSITLTDDEVAAIAEFLAQ